MIFKTLIKMTMVAAMVAATACESDNMPEGNEPTPPVSGADSAYVIASQGTFSNTTTNALLTAASLEEGTVGMLHHH